MKKFLTSLTKWICIAFACFHLYTGFFGPLQSISQRAIHVGGGITIFFLLQTLKNFDKKGKVAVNIALIIATLASCAYVALNYLNIMAPRFSPSIPELVLAGLMLIVIFECTRRSIGIAIPLLSVIAILYALFGSYLPGVWGHNGIKIDYLLQVLFYSDRGVWGTVTGISATIIAVFIIFGAILFATGGGKTFMDLASYLTGNSYGGAAKLATVASGLFGTISGSAGANVATTGAFTIPLMKGLGYDAEFAGGVESAASSGGQIMPPIMGAGAFIMAELLGMSYLNIAKSAIIPSVLFYLGILFAIDCKARRDNYRGLPRDQIPSLKSIMHYSKSLPIFVPLTVLIVFFVLGYTPVTSAMYAIVASVALYLLTDIKNIKARFKVLVAALEQSSKDLLTVISLIACAQILLCIISLTGIGVKFTNLIISLGGSNILLAGICAMFATMIIGMGLPTVAAYMLAAAVMAPALTRIGVEPIAAHFFVFYYAIFAGLTPPVCGTVFIGSAIANSNWVKTAWVAMRLSVGAFIIPFMFLYSPALLLVGSAGDIARCVLTSTIGILALSAGGMGYIIRKLNVIERLFLCAAGVLMVAPSLSTDIIGICFIAVFGLYLFLTRKGFGKHKKDMGKPAEEAPEAECEPAEAAAQA